MHRTRENLQRLCIIRCALLIVAPLSAASGAEPPVDFDRDIRPVLVEHCNGCHGAEAMESGLRLDTVRSLRQGGNRGAAIVPEKSSESLLYLALIGKGDVARMPAESEPLPEAIINRIQTWIDQGAVTPDEDDSAEGEKVLDHWSFRPLANPPVPDVPADWTVHNEIDRFILAKLKELELAPSPEADRGTLIRRLSFDLRGVPPTLEEWQTFAKDTSPDAYERCVDRMLASPHFGERWGRHWLDVARYADSNGFTIDGARSIWKYRDWVIEAFNQDLPFNQFTVDQLAGDLCAESTVAQRIATGFHRNTLVNEEGGTDDEQFRVESIVDRVNTTGTAFLGLTVGCAQCHEHKYDPLTQREYYELFAIFNNCDEPQLPVPTTEQTSQQDQLRRELAEIEAKLKQHDDAALAGLPAWEERLRSSSEVTWTTVTPSAFTTEKGSVLTRLDDGSFVTDFSIPAHDVFQFDFASPESQITAIRLEALTHSSLPNMGPGRAPNGNFVLSEIELVAQVPAESAGELRGKPVSLTEAVADHSQVGYDVSQAIDGKSDTGWAINVASGSLNVNREAIFFVAEPATITNGTPLAIRLVQTHSETGYLLGRFRLSVSAGDPEILKTPASIRSIALLPREQRSAEQQQQLESAFLATFPERKPLAAQLGSLKQREEQLQSQIPTTLVLRERAEPRESHIHIRGDFLRKGARVEGGIPRAFAANPTETSVNRLQFAEWLVGDENPLTARVTVNRIWQRLFGRGLVETENDFGTQGAKPTHPALLDWLAADFRSGGWGIKRLIRQIVTSATYRQSSVMRSDLLVSDPANLWLARQSRVRLEAESIRDVCLAASGQLTRKIGGPSVYPPQPEGIYVMTQVKKAWPESQGADRYRRGMYTFFWRSSPYPNLPTFDAPDANTSCTRRVRSNTPLQALALANDRSFYEIASGLADRALAEYPAQDETRLQGMFRDCLTRDPQPEELARLQTFLEQVRQSVNNSAAAKTEAADGNDTPASNDRLAWTAVARVLLNLDEMITRE